MNKKEYLKVLELFTDVAAAVRIGTTTSIVSAVASGELDISEDELPRLVALLESLIDTYSANGLVQVQRVFQK